MQKLKYLFVFLLSTYLFSGNAQVDYDKIPQVTSTYVLENATIYQTADRVIQKGSILIEDGIIKEVGASVKIPAYAEVIKADSMFVYAAFVDALSHTGVPKADDKKERPKVRFPGLVSDEIAGITPGTNVRASFSSKDKSITDLQKAGFAVSHIVPRGKMMPGYGSVILLSSDPDKDVFLKENSSLFAQFAPASGVSPATFIGIIAKWREYYKNAERKSSYLTKYKSSPAGMPRPNISKAEEALIPVVKKQIPVFFVTPKHKTIARAIALQKELGFDMVLTDVQQGFHSNKKIKAGRYPLLLSLDLPEDKREKDKKDKEEEMNPDSAKDDKKEKEKEEEKKLDPEIEALKIKKEASLDLYLGQAAAYEKDGIPFAFTMLNSKSGDVKKNVAKMIEHGLSEKAALNALTVNAAKVIGVDNLVGTVERGKLANIIITDKPYFDEKSSIRYLFVEGEKIEYEKKEEKKKKAKDGEMVDIAGTWDYTVSMFGGEETGKSVITGSGDDLKISIYSADEPNEAEEAYDITRENNLISFSLDVDTDGGPMTLNMSLEFAPSTYEGTVSVGEMGSFPMTGNRVGDPKSKF